MNQEPVMNRNEVYDLLDGERAYQDRRWGPQRYHSPAEWILYMQDYLREAQQLASREASETADAKVMDVVRKIGAMAVAALEQNGGPARAG